jgi:hypothetical protein
MSSNSYSSSERGAIRFSCPLLLEEDREAFADDPELGIAGELLRLVPRLLERGRGEVLVAILPLEAGTLGGVPIPGLPTPIAFAWDAERDIPTGLARFGTGEAGDLNFSEEPKPGGGG